MSEAQSLAQVIRDAEYQWKGLHLAGMAGYNALPRGSRVDHIAAAVAAHLANEAVVERVALALWARAHDGPDDVDWDDSCVPDEVREVYRSAARAAVAAVVGKAPHA